MTRRLLLGLCLGATPLLAQTTSTGTASGTRRPGEYSHGPDSQQHADVPSGRLEGPFEWHSRVIPGTVRRYWIFVPAQYTGATPACLLVFQDGQRATSMTPNAALRVPIVMANLIHKKEMPVTIGLFVTPGNTTDHYPDTLGMSNPNHRAEEYDVLSDAYARLLIDELIPELSKKYKITDNPDGRVIGGTSSGAIAAWTVAWERPDQFRKVISIVGSYTSIAYRPARGNQPMMPGGDLYPSLIRKSPIKPIRIFLQDGSRDLNNEHGDWFLANQQMLAALEYANADADRRRVGGARYDISHVWGDGEHSDGHGGTLLPDILRWMWRDWRTP